MFWPKSCTIVLSFSNESSVQLVTLLLLYRHERSIVDPHGHAIVFQIFCTYFKRSPCTHAYIHIHTYIFQINFPTNLTQRMNPHDRNQNLNHVDPKDDPSSPSVSMVSAKAVLVQAFSRSSTVLGGVKPISFKAPSKGIFCDELAHVWMRWLRWLLINTLVSWLIQRVMTVKLWSRHY